MSATLELIDAGLEVILKVVDHLTAARQVAQQGGTLTDEQRAALDVANGARKSRLLSAIDARIGPDREDVAAGGPNVDPVAPAPAAPDPLAAATTAALVESLRAQLDEERQARVRFEDALRSANERVAAMQAGGPDPVRPTPADGPDTGPDDEGARDDVPPPLPFVG